MKIAVLVNQFPKVSETFILNQIAGLIDRGHTVDIFACYRSEDHIDDGQLRKYELLDRTRYLTAPASRKERLMAAMEAALKRGWKQPVHLMRSINLLPAGRRRISLEMLCQHRFLLERSAYDMIHCHFGPVGIFGQHLREIGALEGPLLTTFHGFDIGSYVRQHGAGAYAELFRKGDAFTCSSHFVRGKLIAAGCDPVKLIQFKLGTDLARFDFAERKIGSDGVIRLITIARLVEKKGIEYSIRAVADLVKQFPKLHYTIVGDGNLRQKLSLLIEQLDLQQHVMLVGWKTPEEVRHLLSRSHIFVLASVISSNGDFEGQGLVLQEAQAMGLPVVCTNHNGFGDSVLNGESGFLVPERNVDALSTRLADLIRQSELWPGIGRKGRAFVEAEFDLDKRNDALVDLYSQVAAQSSEPAFSTVCE
jgi:colanic acid/amylovoran/stewartan biosynthesis glycosyltransferase WcaL/AmsK/CpsK